MKRHPFPRSLFTARIGLLAALTAMQLYASAQQPQSQTKQAPETAAQTPPPVLRVTTRLVEVNVIVRDGLKFSREVAIIDGAVLVRFVACDLGSRAIGSVDIPLQKVFPHESSPITAILR